MNTSHRTARFAALLLVALVSWAIAAPLAFAGVTSSPRTPTARIPQMHWYRWHPTARLLHEHYGSKVVIGVESMQNFKALRVEYGFGLGTAHEIPALHAVVATVSDAQLQALLTRAPRDARIRYVSPIREKRNALSMPNDPYLSTVDGATNLPYEWAFLATHVDRALDFTGGDPHVVVGVIDSGVAHVPDLAGKIDSLWSVTGGTIAQVFDDNDDQGHGTAVASLIAANVDDGFGLVGFGGDTHIIGVHAGIEGNYNDADLAIALTKLVSLGVRIVNMSLGGKVPSDPVLVDAIHSAAAQNVLLVAAAGNFNSDVFWPAADLQPSSGGRSYGVAVGATDGTGRRASFSNWGDHLSIMAPGAYSSYMGVVAALPPASRLEEMFPTWTGEANAHYAYLGGTSFAAPEVAGIAALVWAAKPELANYQVADILKQSASRTAPDWTPQMGCGMLDAGAALELATSRPASAWAAAPSDGKVCSASGSAPAAWPTEKPQMIVFGAVANKHVGDRDFRVNAHASSGLPLSFTAYGSCSTSGARLHLLRTGWCTVIAEQGGNDDYEPAQPVTQRFHIAKGREQARQSLRRPPQKPRRVVLRGRPFGCSEPSLLRAGEPRDDRRLAGFVADVDDVEHLVHERPCRRIGALDRRPEMSHTGGTRIGGQQLDERLADAASLVAVGHRECDFRARARVFVTDELREPGRKRIAADVGDERVAARIDPRERMQLRVGEPRLGSVEAPRPRLRAEPLEQRRDRLDIAVAERADRDLPELLVLDDSRMHGSILEEGCLLDFARSGHLPLARSGHSDETGARAVGGGRRTRVQAELAQDVRHVAVHRVPAEHEPYCDIAVAQTLGDEPQDFPLARRQFLEIGGRLARRRRHAEERRDRDEDVVEGALPREMRVADEHDELGVRDECRQLLARTKPDRAVSSPVDDQRRKTQAGERLPNVCRERQLEQVRRHLGTRGVALERGERRALGRGSTGGKGVGEHAAAEPPVLAHELDQRVASRRVGKLRAVRERPVEHDPVDALAVARRIDDGRAAGERAADEAEAFEAEVVDHRVEHRELVLERHRLLRPHAIRDATAEAVVPDRLLPGSEALHEAPVRRDLPVLDDVAHPPGRQDDRRSGADGGECDAMAVEPEEACLLRAHAGTVLAAGAR
jgi:subtilisin family serine protease